MDVNVVNDEEDACRFIKHFALRLMCHIQYQINIFHGPQVHHLPDLIATVVFSLYYLKNVRMDRRIVENIPT